METLSCVPPLIFSLLDRSSSSLSQRINRVTCATNFRLQPALCQSSANVFTWGYGLQGQLGHGDFNNQSLPKMVEYFNQTLSAGDFIRQCSCGSFHTGCVTNNGKLFTWGRTQDNRLGHGDSQSAADEQLPRDIASLDQTIVTKIVCGDTHSLAITKEGRILSWGKNNHGQCGRPTPPPPPTHNSGFSPVSSSLFRTREKEPEDPWQKRQPVHPLAVGEILEFPSETFITDVCCGKLHSMALSDAGVVYVWGQGSEGALGISNSLNESSNLGDQVFPIPIDAKHFEGKKVTKISAGFHFSAAVTENGKLYTWGSDQYGQLGLGKECRHVLSPREVRSLSGHKVIDVSCGQYHMAAMVESGEIFTWGYGNRVVSCGGGHTAVINSINQLYICGRGRDGQLGRDDHLESTVANRLEPVVVEIFQSLKMSVIDISLGQEHSLAITKKT